MGQLVDERLAETEEEISSINEETVIQEQDPVETQESLPDKYQGKSTAEIVQMHQEAEKLLGRQSSEVGELRKVVDTYIQGQTQLDQGNKAQAEVEEIDFFSEPEKAIQQQIAQHPSILQAEKDRRDYKQATAKAQLQKLHPDMATVIQDVKFQEWVTASKVRQQLFQQADKLYDYETADELLNLWKDRQRAVQQTANSEKLDRKQTIKNASVGTNKGSSAPSSKKIYRRADIINLMKDDPRRYLALADEITQAYAEKRVR
jgi:hypothetical protein|tara:strand:+ start:735 stop:1517 length:783 start_codon:yes stop_codon:yes gene_type:complete